MRRVLSACGWLALVVAIAVLRHWRGRSGIFTHSNSWVTGFIVAAAIVLVLRLIVGIWSPGQRYAAYRAAARSALDRRSRSGD